MGPEDGIASTDVVLMGKLTGSIVSRDDAGDHTGLQASTPWPKAILVTQHQAAALQKILEMDKTAWISHGGLKGLLGITDSQILALMDVVEALKK